MRLARTIASDILIYNRDLVSEAIRNDTVFEDLAEQIEEGRRHFASRVAPDVAKQHDFLDRALVDVLLFRAMNDAQDPA